MIPPPMSWLGAALSIALIAAGCLAVQADPGPVSSTDAAPSHPLANGDGIGYDLVGTGWASRDITATEPLLLTYTLTHDTMDDLCDFSDDGAGIYDQGHHSLVAMWRTGSDPLLDGQGWLWIGTPYNDFWPDQTGTCGVSEPLDLAAGETARIVIATSVPGFHLDVTTNDETSERQALALDPRRGHEHVTPEATGTEHSDGIFSTAVAHEWRATFDLDGPALLFAQRWYHSGDGPPSTSYFAHAHLRHVGFDRADAYRPTPHGLPTHPGWGFGWGLTVDGYGLYPAHATDAGIVAAYVQETARAAVHTGPYDIGVHVLSVPLANA